MNISYPYTLEDPCLKFRSSFPKIIQFCYSSFVFLRKTKRKEKNLKIKLSPFLEEAVVFSLSLTLNPG